MFWRCDFLRQQYPTSNVLSSALTHIWEHNIQSIPHKHMKSSNFNENIHKYILHILCKRYTHTHFRNQIKIYTIFNSFHSCPRAPDSLQIFCKLSAHSLTHHHHHQQASWCIYFVLEIVRGGVNPEKYGNWFFFSPIDKSTWLRGAASYFYFIRKRCGHRRGSLTFSL